MSVAPTTHAGTAPPDTPGDETAVCAELPSALELLQREVAVRRLHPAQDVVDGVLWYGLSLGGHPPQLVMITSARTAFRADQLPDGLALRHADPGPSSVGREVALRWLGQGEPGSIAEAIDALAIFFTRYVAFHDSRTALLLAAWTLATWCYRAFRVFPYLSIRSAEKRCGKSRLLGLMARVGFNASPVTTHPTEAQLYRSAARTGGVQFFDEVETLRGDRERFDALITVLNVGFERGGVVTRLERRGSGFIETPCEAYAPRVLAGIAGLKETLEDRALSVFMLRRRREEPVARLTADVDAEAQAIRDRCALGCLSHIREILAASVEASTALERQGIDDRAVDLWSPLVALVLVADREDQGRRAGALLTLARELSALREADADAGTTARLVEMLDTIRMAHGDTIVPGDLLEVLRARPGWEWVKSGRRLAGLLNPLGIVRRQLWNGGRRRWCYVLEAEQLADLRVRYGFAGGDGAEDTVARTPSADRPEAPVPASDVVSTPMNTAGSPLSAVAAAVMPEPVRSRMNGGVSPHHRPGP